jgi:ABC-type glycerol-3-phosphate transport system substrate-binding protein
MRKIVTLGICMAVFLVLFSANLAVAAQVTLRFSDWHLTEDVFGKSVTEGMDIFQKRHPNIKVVLEPVSYKDKETKYTV